MWDILLVCVMLNVIPSVQGEVGGEVKNQFRFVLGLTEARDSRYGWPQPLARTYIILMTCIPMFPISTLNSRPPSVEVSEIHITIENCILPKNPLADGLQALTQNVTKVRELYLKNSLLPSTGIPENYTAGLQLRTLEIINITNFNVSLSFFKNLRDLKRLKVENTRMPHLPPGMDFRLLGLTLEGTSVGVWENCESMAELTIIGLSIDQLPKKWPDDCYRLRSLELTKMTPETVTYVEKSMIGAPEAMPAPLSNIHKLKIDRCSLDKYPMTLLTTPLHIEELDLSYNHGLINNFEGTDSPQFPTLKDLTILNMAYTSKVYDVNPFFEDLLPRLPKLKQLYLDGNPIHMEHYSCVSVLSKLKSLQHLSIKNVKFVWKAFMHLQFNNLTKLDWTHTEQRIDTLTLYALPSTKAGTLEVDLRGYTVKNVIVEPDFTEYYQYTDIPKLWIVKKGYKLTVRLDSVDCDCNNVVLASALKDFPQFLSMPNVKCAGKNTSLIDEHIENLRCRKAMVNGCVRRIYMNRLRNWEEVYTTDVDCSNAGTMRWPKPKGFRGFNASGNSISTIKNAYLPDTLEWVDLSNNNITRMRPEDVVRLFTPKQRLWFSGNPIVCDCDNRDLLEALKTYQSMVQDFDEITCSNNGELLRSISIEELCRIDLYFLWVTLGILAIFIAITALVLNQYWSDLKAVLYARGWFLYCLKEEDIDADRPYDAFVSFAHGDHEYVIEHLVPKLEGEPNYYKICVHYRDWSVGEWIPVQIMNSVRASKRTIIVLSRNFVESWWGALEFRHAFANSVHEGRNRLLVLILDDVLTQHLNPDLKGYLESNTYLKCDDPLFWDKLCYAMPHVSKWSRNDGTSREMGEEMHSYIVNTDFVQ